MRAGAAFALCFAVLSGSANGFAQEGERFPSLRGEIRLETQNDWTYRSGTNDLHATIESTIRFHFTRRLSLETVFDPHGPFPEQLFLRYATQRWGIRAGKINPHFGIAWDLAPGIYGADFAEDYEITERIGVGGFLRLGNNRLGFHRLTADAFFRDTSFPSRSLALTLESRKIPRLPGLGYQLGFSWQDDEYGYAAGLIYGFSPWESVGIDLLAEYVYRRGRRESCHDLTQSADLYWRGWNLAVSYSLRNLHVPGGSDFRDYLFQASVGYQLEMGLGIGVGWRYAREVGIRRQGIGALVGYTVAF